MILAIDPGMAKCGWAVVEPGTGRVSACGVVSTERDLKVTSSVDRARRIGEVFSALPTPHQFGSRSFSAIAGEAPLGFGPIHAVAPQIMLWGALVVMAIRLGHPLYEVAAKTWQHAVMPEPAVDPPTGKPAGKRRATKINYKHLEAKLAAYMGRAALVGIVPRDRTHALDAVGVGVLLALRPDEAKIVRGL